MANTTFNGKVRSENGSHKSLKLQRLELLQKTQLSTQAETFQRVVH